MATQTDPAVFKFLSERARKGGKARLTKMTAAERTRIARLAANARWGKKAGSPVPPDPNGPSSPDRDRQGAEAGIMLTRRAAHRANSDRLSGRSHAAAA
jgi:hypothetical protein